MVKILHIRRNPEGGNDGTVNYCQGLYEMFKDDSDCQVLSIPDIPQMKSVFKYTYSDDTLSEYISQADVVHVNGYTAMGTVKAIRMAKKMGKKVVYTAHWHPFENLSHPLLGKLFFFLLLAPVIRNCVDVVTAINSEDEAFFKRIHHNVVRIPHWMNDNSEIPDNVERKKNMILFVGRLNDPVKGIEHLLALPEGKYEVHCVGRGIMPTDRIDFIHHVNIPVENLSALYAQASLVVVPSKYEAFSFVALEAMEKGTPVLMSERVRIADYLCDVSGYDIFNYGDMNVFVGKIDSTMQMPVDAEKVREIFNREKIKNGYKDLYLSL